MPNNTSKFKRIHVLTDILITLSFFNGLKECYCKTIPVNPKYIASVPSEVQTAEKLEYFQVVFAKQVINAMRAWNFDQLVDTFKQARIQGAFPDWYLEYQANCLRACDKNGILLTYHIVDSMGFYYLQLIESVRKDVSIVPVYFLQYPWYLSLMESNDPLHMNPPELRITREEIRNITFEISPVISENVESYEIEFFMEISKFYNLECTSNPVYKKGINTLVVDNIKNRPIYMIAGLKDPSAVYENVHMILNGLVYQLNEKTVPEIERINWSSIEKLLLEPQYFNEINHADTSLSSFITQIREQYTELACLFVEHTFYVQNKPSEKLISLLQAGPLKHAILPKLDNNDDSSVHSKMNNH
ncbi:hypothetical protein HQ585_06780 [candidate division KSB1 bacterium]|nr:hypothetical protein [candidate division KSB1 bacterium]